MRNIGDGFILRASHGSADHPRRMAYAPPIVGEAAARRRAEGVIRARVDGTRVEGRSPTAPVARCTVVPPRSRARAPAGAGALVRRSSEDDHFFFGGTEQVVVAVLPAASVAVTTASPLRVMCQSTAPENGTADGVAPGAWVSLMYVPGA